MSNNQSKAPSHDYSALTCNIDEFRHSREKETYKYCYNASRIGQPEFNFKMQFKVIASVLLFFVAQTNTMATPTARGTRSDSDSCTLPLS